MFVLIADSGSTKTDWVLIENNTLCFQTSTIGFNPYFQSKDQIKEVLNAKLKPDLLPYLKSIKHVFYYGSGCSTEKNCQLVETAITESLGTRNVEVSHDLLASARALCKNEWGIAAILGTGSNSCLYDGKQILENVPSTGYLWSDYGGGSQIGKYFIRDYFEDRLPSDLKKSFEAAGYNRETILEQVYKNTVPSKYLATVSLFVSKNIHHQHALQVLTECFDSFFTQQIAKYSNSKHYKINLVGSVGYYYKAIIEEVAKKRGYQLGMVLKSPMEGLIEYHTSS